MVKIIETQFTKSGSIIVDHQSRVIECLSWREYKKQFIFYGDIPPKESKTLFGSLEGKSIPYGARMTKLKHDCKTLYCDFNTKFNDCTLMAYLLEEEL